MLVFANAGSAQKIIRVDFVYGEGKEENKNQCTTGYFHIKMAKSICLSKISITKVATAIIQE